MNAKAYYHDATTAIGIIEAKDKRIRELEAENTMLRESLRLTAEERGRLELELKQCRRLGDRLRDEERNTDRD
jgi:hypothetical protein